MGEEYCLYTKSGVPLAMNGDTLVDDTERDLTQEVNMQLAPIKARTEELLGTIDTVIGLASGFLDERTSKNFKSTFESIDKTFKSVEQSAEDISSYLSDNKGNFDAISKSFRSLSEELASNSEDISKTIANIGAISDSLANARLSETVNNVESITAFWSTFGRTTIGRKFCVKTNYQWRGLIATWSKQPTTWTGYYLISSTIQINTYT